MRRILPVLTAFGTLMPLTDPTPGQIMAKKSAPRPELLGKINEMIASLVGVTLDSSHLRIVTKEGFVELVLNGLIQVRLLQGEGQPEVHIIPSEHFLGTRESIIGEPIELRRDAVTIVPPATFSPTGFTILRETLRGDQIFISLLQAEAGKSRFNMTIMTAGMHGSILIRTKEASEEITIIP